MMIIEMVMAVQTPKALVCRTNMAVRIIGILISHIPVNMMRIVPNVSPAPWSAPDNVKPMAMNGIPSMFMRR